MVLPLIAAGIGAVGSIVGGMMGSKAQDKANQMNYQIALMNYYQQEAARREALAEARRQEEETHLGTTDAEGNRTYFVPGQGWVSELSPQSKEMRDQYRQEENMQLRHDIPLKRQMMDKNVERQGKEDVVAGGILQALLRNYRRDPSEAVGRRNRMSTEAANEGFDTAMTQAMVDNLRTGGGNQAKIASQMGRDKMKALRTAFMENAEGAQQAEDDRYMTEQGNYANLYNTFATRASAMPDTTYNPRNQDMSAALQSAMSSGRGASGSLLNAFGANPAQFNFKSEPNMGLATTIAQAGSSIAGGLNLYDSTRGQGNQDYGNYARQNYFPSAPSAGTTGVNANMYKPGTGLF